MSQQRPQLRQYGTLDYLLIGLRMEASIFGVLLLLIVGGFNVSLYLRGAIPEGVATVVALILCAIFGGYIVGVGRRAVEDVSRARAHRRAIRARMLARSIPPGAGASAARGNEKQTRRPNP